MKINLNRINDDFLFECTNSAGHKILIDNTSQPDAKGVSPMETVLMAVAGCSGIDIVSILHKQRQTITNFSAEVVGERHPLDQAKPFKTITVVFRIDGEVSPIKALKAAILSFDDYCSVSKSLDSSVEIKYEVIVNGEKV